MERNFRSVEDDEQLGLVGEQAFEEFVERGEARALLEYRVEGNTLMRPIDIERAVTPYLGEEKSIKDVESARQSLEKLYHDHGYQTVLVNIPQQEVVTIRTWSYAGGTNAAGTAIASGGFASTGGGRGTGK